MKPGRRHAGAPPLPSPTTDRAGGDGRRGLAATWATALILLLLAAGGAALSRLSQAAASEPPALRIAVSRGPVSLPVHVAEANGFFAREGVAVRLLECGSGRDCFEQLAAGRADLATAAELVMTLNRLKGSDSAVIATLSSSAQHIKLVGRRSAGIGAPPTMRGKRVATAAGSSAQYFLDAWLLYHDIDPADVTGVALPPDRLTDALARREVDAVAIWEPVARQTIAALGPDAVVMPNPRVYIQHFSLVAGRVALDQRSADVVRLLRALKRAERFIDEQPETARRLLAPRAPGEPSGDDLAEHDFRLALPQSLIATMDSQARWAIHRGLAGPEVPVNLMRSIEPAPLRQAVPGAVTMVR